MPSSTRVSEPDASVLDLRLVPWRDWNEWYKVKALLFSADHAHRCQGVQHITMWGCRERVPFAAELTSQIVEVRLNDQGPGAWCAASLQRREEELRLLYSSVVVRAVNGLTGFEQKNLGIIPVSSLARDIGIPGWVVELRHEAAHRQLPRLVNLRLAMDFLLTHLWQTYWCRQADHLNFMWGAYDELLRRCKITGDALATISWRREQHPKTSRPSGADVVFGKVRKAGLDWTTKGSGAKTCITSTNRAESKKGATSEMPSPVVASGHPKKRRKGIDGRPMSAVSVLTDPAQDVGATASKGDVDGTIFQTERARKSASRAKGGANNPLCLSLGCVNPQSSRSIGTAAAAATAAATAAKDVQNAVSPTGVPWALISLLVGGDDPGPTAKERGYLLPSSIKRYATQSTPGAFDEEATYRLITRWDTILENCARKWRGFSASLLVRLVEVMLASALRRGISTSESKSLELQGHFIGLWVRHLLSRQWHGRKGNKKIRMMLGMADIRSKACAKGLSYGGKCSLRQLASPQVLRAAYYPVHELLERCRTCLATLPAESVQSSNLSLDGESHGSSPHWARAALRDVCDSLEATFHRRTSDAVHEVPISTSNDRCVSSSAASDVDKAKEVSSSVNECLFSAQCENAVAGGGGGGGNDNKSSRSSCTPNISEHTKYVEKEAAKDDCSNENSPIGGTNETRTMMDLDAFEKWLTIKETINPSAAHATTARVPTECTSHGAVSATDVVKGKATADAGHEIEQQQALVMRQSCEDEMGSKDDIAWDFVEDWTPCAIGTLPGWSRPPL